MLLLINILVTALSKTRIRPLSSLHVTPSATCALKPLSQLAHDHFKTLCDPAFWHSHDGSPTLHELSLPLHAIFRSPAVASDFWACLKFRGDCVRRFLSHWVSRSLVRASYNVVCTCKSGARTFEVVRWFACLDASVVQPWDCCSTCGMWSFNVYYCRALYSTTCGSRIHMNYISF